MRNERQGVKKQIMNIYLCNIFRRALHAYTSLVHFPSYTPACCDSEMCLKTRRVCCVLCMVMPSLLMSYIYDSSYLIFVIIFYCRKTIQDIAPHYPRIQLLFAFCFVEIGGSCMIA